MAAETFMERVARLQKADDARKKAGATGDTTLGYMAHQLTEAMSHRRPYFIALRNGQDLHGYPVRRTVDETLKGRGSTLVFEMRGGRSFRLIDVARLS